MGDGLLDHVAKWSITCIDTARKLEISSKYAVVSNHVTSHLDLRGAIPSTQMLHLKLAGPHWLIYSADPRREGY